MSKAMTRMKALKEFAERHTAIQAKGRELSHETAKLDEEFKIWLAKECPAFSGAKSLTMPEILLHWTENTFEPIIKP